MAYEDSQIDKRVVKRNIHKGIVDAKELQKQIQHLEDAADNVDMVPNPGSTIDDDED
jgi:hypothetical protein